MVEETSPVFDDVGKAGILICYDSEFPELACMQAEEGMILFVPFGRDTEWVSARPVLFSGSCDRK